MVLDTLKNLWEQTGFMNLEWGNYVMVLVALVFLYLAIAKGFEPLLLVPIAFGMLLVNLFPDIMKEIKGGEAGGLLRYFYLLDEWSILPSLIFLGVGAMTDFGPLIANPKSFLLGAAAQIGIFAAYFLAIIFGFNGAAAAAISIIGGADGPMVLFTSLMLAPHLFVPISVIAYLYLSLTYAGYPWLLKMLVPKALRGKDIMFYAPEVPKSKKFIFILVCCALLCLLLPMAAPLIMSFFLGMAIKEAEIVPYQDLIENTLLYTGTLMLGLLLGTLCEASTLLNPKVAPLIVLGILALAVSGAVGILGGYVVYWFKKGDFNPVVGIAGVSCVPTTAKIAQHAAEDEDPFAIVLPVAMGANIGGVIVSAIACGVFIATIGMVK